MKKVQVLLSAYNGEKVIKEQIDSILNQTYENISIFVRDDGSKDGTIEILKEYENAGKIKLELGENKGFIGSFHWLIANADDADYYAFSDQDDVWFPEKIAMAMEKLTEHELSREIEGTDQNKPVLYFSNYDLYDDKEGEMIFTGHAFPEDVMRRPSFHNAIVDCMPLGFNSVFNKKAKEMMTEHVPKCSCGHDWWTYLVCQGMGTVIYDNRPTVKYRRTGNNVSAGGMSFVKFQIWRIKKFLVGGYFKNIHRMQAEFYHYYKDELNKEDRKLLELFARIGYNPIVAIKKAFYGKRFREKMVDELMLRFFFLIGRL